MCCMTSVLGFDGSVELGGVVSQASPCNVSTEGFPPLLVEIGDCECLFDQVTHWTKQTRTDGVRIKQYQERGMVHVFPLLFASVTHPDEKSSLPPQAAFTHMKEFMDMVLDKSESEKVDYFDDNPIVIEDGRAVAFQSASVRMSV